MVARPAPDLPTAGPWAFEPKFDGFRAIATADRRRVRLHSRQNRPLTRYFPEIITAIVTAIAARFAGHVVLDGELVVCGAGGLDFMALQRRLTAARRAAAEAPATFVVFDVLAAGGTDLRTHPYWVRRALLLQLLDDAAPPLAVVPMTTDGEAARAWLRGHLDAGIEASSRSASTTATYRSGGPGGRSRPETSGTTSTRHPNSSTTTNSRVRGDGTPTSGEAGLSPATPLDGDGRDAGRTVGPGTGDRCEPSDPDHRLRDHGCRPDLLPALNKSV
jgi:hypothetical protein